MKEQIVSLVAKKLKSQVDSLRTQFLESGIETGVRYCIVDDLLPEELSSRIHQAFPEAASMRLMDSLRE